MQLEIRQNGPRPTDTEILLDGKVLDNVVSFTWHREVGGLDRFEIELHGVEISTSQGGSSHFAEVYITGAGS